MTAVMERQSADLTEFWNHVRTGHKEGHYYLSLFGFRNYDPVHVMEQIARGFSYAAFERFLRNTDLPQRVLAAVVTIPERTLARRREAGRFEAGVGPRVSAPRPIGFGSRREAAGAETVAVGRWSVISVE